jgi:hypothetical protein
MMARTNTEIVSRLPHYEAKRSQDYKEWLIVTCPHEDCPGGQFMVREKDWLAAFRTRPISADRQSVLIEGRTCPYCFRVGRLPLRRNIN